MAQTTDQQTHFYCPKCDRTHHHCCKFSIWGQTAAAEAKWTAKWNNFRFLDVVDVLKQNSIGDVHLPHNDKRLLRSDPLTPDWHKKLRGWHISSRGEVEYGNAWQFHALDLRSPYSYHANRPTRMTGLFSRKGCHHKRNSYIGHRRDQVKNRNTNQIKLICHASQW